jgi:selenocysteine lyase/cysteine desulfurase
MVELKVAFEDVSSGVSYLNHAKEAILSPVVKLSGFRALQTATWDLDSSADRKNIRVLFGQLICASADDVAIMPSTAFAMTLAANNLKRLRRKGGKIILLQDQMCSEVYAWQNIADSEWELEIVPPCGDLTLAVMERLDANVAVVCLPPLHWSHGSLLNLESISTKCHELNIDLVVDGTQGIGIWPLDATKLKPTMITCSVQKWLRAPPGLALVYLDKSIHDSWQPLDQHGLNRALPPYWNAHSGTMRPQGYPEEYFSTASKFDAGGSANQIHMAMLRASLVEVCSLDISTAQKQLQTLIQPLVDWARRKGMWVPPNHANHLMGIRPPCTVSVDDMLNVCSRLESEGVYISVRNGVFRISPYITNTAEDIQRLLDGLERYLPISS